MRVLGKGKTALAIKKLFPDAELFDDTDKEHYDIDSDELTIVSPGFPPYNYLVKNTQNKQSDYDLFLKDNMFTIWISGTNGKTTTTQMIHHLLKDDGFRCGGNIGTPLASLSGKSNKIILETSSFTLHYTNKVKPNIYILLPISEDHLSWHGTFSEYENAKLKPVLTMNKEDIAIIPAKYKDIDSKATIYFYKSSEDLAKQFNIDTTQIRFNEPFLLDSLLALATQKLVNKKTDYKQINSYIVDKHKVEEFKDNSNRVWVDDSKATNVDATIWALKGYKDKKIHLILGGDDKGAELDPLFKELQNYHCEIYCIGTNEDRLIELSKKYEIKSNRCNSLDIAVEMINKSFLDKDNEVAILSPAAASLDQFNSYKERGEVFKKLVFEIN